MEYKLISLAYSDIWNKNSPAKTNTKQQLDQKAYFAAKF